MLSILGESENLPQLCKEYRSRKHLAKRGLRTGVTGQPYLDAGFVYAPYIPLIVTPTLLDDKEEESE